MSAGEVQQPNAELQLDDSTPPTDAKPAPVQPWTTVSLPETHTAPDAPAPAPSPKAEAVVSPSAPGQDVAPRVAPEPAPKVEAPKSKDLDRVITEMKDERDRLRALADKQISRERLLYLREIGARDGMADADLLMLAPQVDPTTAEGRASLDAWREKSSVYFDNRDPHTTVNVEEIAKGYKASNHGTFGASLAANILKAMGTNK